MLLIDAPSQSRAVVGLASGGLTVLYLWARSRLRMVSKPGSKALHYSLKAIAGHEKSGKIRVTYHIGAIGPVYARARR